MAKKLKQNGIHIAVDTSGVTFDGSKKYDGYTNSDITLTAKFTDMEFEANKGGDFAVRARAGAVFTLTDCTITARYAGGVLAGGGKADADGLACACVAGGLGVGRKNKEATRCMCVASGFGESTQCIMLGA